MDVPVLIEPVPGKGFVARAGSPFDWMAEGATEAEAMANLQVAAMKCIAGGCVVASIDVPDRNDPLAMAKAKGASIEPPKGDHPLLKWAGTWDLNDPLIQEWQKAVEEYRTQIDNDPSVY